MFQNLAPEAERSLVSNAVASCVDACLKVLLPEQADGLVVLANISAGQCKSAFEVACTEAVDPSKRTSQAPISAVKTILFDDGIAKRFVAYLAAAVLCEFESPQYMSDFLELESKRRRKGTAAHGLWSVDAPEDSKLFVTLNQLLEKHQPTVTRLQSFVHPRVGQLRDERTTLPDMHRTIARFFFNVVMLTRDYARYLAESASKPVDPAAYECMSLPECFVDFQDEYHPNTLATDATKYHHVVPPVDGRGRPLTLKDVLVPLSLSWLSDFKKAAAATASSPSPQVGALTQLEFFDVSLAQTKLIDSREITFVRPALYRKLWARFGGTLPLMEFPVDSIDERKVATIATKQSKIEFTFGTPPHEVKCQQVMWIRGTLPEAALQLLTAKAETPHLTETEKILIAKWQRRVEKDPAALKWGAYMNHTDSLRTVSDRLTVVRRAAASRGYSSSSSSLYGSSSSSSLSYATPGHVGLSNIGNTCYMNSALQCLSNTRAFRDAMKALPSTALLAAPVSRSLKDLFTRMWAGETTVVTPTEFKSAFSKRVPRFDGWDQQDSIEFVNALIDAVLEELNPIKTKSYVERNSELDSQRNDEENSAYYWTDFCKNNQGFVFDQFYGQMRSEFTCLTCSNSACVYDAFSCVPVAIDTVDLKSLDVCVAVQSPAFKLTARFRLRLPKSSCSPRDLANELEATLKNVSTPSFSGPLRLQKSNGDFFNVTAEHMKIVEAYNTTTSLLEMDRSTTPIYFDNNTAYTVFILPELEERVAEPARAIKAALAKKRAAEAAAAAAKAKAKAAAAEAAKAAASAASQADGVPAADSADATTSPTPADSTATSADAKPVTPPPPPPAADDDDEEQMPRVPVEYGDVLLKIVDANGEGGHLLVHAPKNCTAVDLWAEVRRVVAPFVRPVAKDAEPDAQTDGQPPVAPSPSAASASVPTTNWVLTKDSYTIRQDDATYHPLKGAAYAARYHHLHLKIDQCMNITMEDDKTLTTLPPRDYVSPQRTLSDLMETMTKAQELVGMDQWYCSKCKTHTDSRKKDSIYVLPEYMIIQLKRFTVSADGYTMRKIETAVPFEENLDMTPYVSARLQAEGRCKYKLYGVVHHSGSLAFGHYTATALAPPKKSALGGALTTSSVSATSASTALDSEEEEANPTPSTPPPVPAVSTSVNFNEPRVWVEYNDSSCYVSSTGPSRSSAYLLFYERVPAGHVDAAATTPGGGAKASPLPYRTIQDDF